MEYVNAWLTDAGVVLGLMVAIWLVSLALRNSGIVDIFWGSGFVIVTWVSYALVDGYLPRRLLLAALVTIWGLRLSLYLLWRTRGKPEDFRYARWRQESGSRWWWVSFFKVFLLQGVLLWIISAPLIVAEFSPTPASLGLVEALAVGIWAIGFFFEAVGDWQLSRFKADPANHGKLLETGVWRTTRHPNYFGDAVQWWGFYLFAVAAGGAWTIFSPLLMTFLLIRVSGAGMLEKTLQDSKPGYRAYMERTSPFVPWFRRGPR